MSHQQYAICKAYCWPAFGCRLAVFATCVASCLFDIERIAGQSPLCSFVVSTKACSSTKLFFYLLLVPKGLPMEVTTMTKSGSGCSTRVQ